MRTLIVLNRFFPDSTYGAETLTLHVAEELRKRGDDVSFVCARPSTNKVSTEFELIRDDFDSFRVDRATFTEGNRNTLDARSFRNKWFGESFREYLRSRKPDRALVFHIGDLSGIAFETLSSMSIDTVSVATGFWMVCIKSTLLKTSNELCSGPSTLSANCINCVIQETIEARSRHRTASAGDNRPSRLSGVPIYNSAKFMVNLVRRKNYLKRQLRTLKALAVPTRFMASILKHNGIPERLIRTIPYGIDLARIRTVKKREGSTLSIGYIGSLSPHKGVDVLVSAFRKAQVEDRAALSIYGDCQIPYSYYQDQLNRIAGQSPAVKFLGLFPQSEISRVISDLDALVVPSIWYENSPLVILWAFACGIPVIGSRVPGISELVRDGENGFLFERGNAHQLSAIIKSLTDDPVSLTKMTSHTPPVKTISTYVDELEDCFLPPE